ncbi:MAG: sialate O-acetylesterase [Planctomycetota bacterium]
MCHVSRRTRFALLVPWLLLVSAAAAAQQTRGFAALPPPAGPILHLDAGQGVDLELGSIASRWSDAGGGALDLVQSSGARMPLLGRHLVNGRPALHFDGDDLLSRADGMPTGDYTKVAVVVLDDYGANNNVLSGATEHALFYGGTDRAQLYHSGTFVTSAVPTPPGEPTILVATYDADTGEGRLYQNGELVGTGVAPPNTDESLQIGAFAGGNFLRGSIPELMLYDRVLSANERGWIEAVLDTRYRTRRAPEVAFSRLPRPGQILQRDASDLAVVLVEGSVETPWYDEIELEVRQDGLPWQMESANLAYAGSSAPFSLSATIAAGLHEYDLIVTLVAGPCRVTVREVDRLACGDTLLVNGQSNAVAGDYWSEELANQSQSPWIRSFGSASVSGDLTLDLHWAIADGEGFNDHGTIGAWALRAAAVLLAQEQVPIGLLNGGVGGTAIASHLRNDADPTDPATIYGRLLYRAQEAGIDTWARALLWYQGESDGEDVAGYTASFAILHGAWLEDYPALEKIYLFQIRKGCGVVGPGVREFHRTAPDIYSDVEVMSTTAAPGHDGCHFQYAGYAELGDRIARLLARDLHGSLDTQEIDPPNISSAWSVGANDDQILLTFRDLDDVLVWEAGSEAYFYFNDATTVVSGSVLGNAILLQLSGSSSATRISYDGHAFDGPWIKNARGVGALTFFDVTVHR